LTSGAAADNLDEMKQLPTLGLSLLLSGCILGYPLQTGIDSAGVFAVARKQSPDCLRSIEVFERPVSKRQAQIGPDSAPVWRVEAAPDRCISGFPPFRYGIVPEGMVEQAPAPPLTPGRTYWIRGYAISGLYSGEFVAPESATGR
jgi:hypothetical protein